MASDTPAAHTESSRRFALSRRVFLCLAAALLVLLAAELFFSHRNESQVWDEGDHLYSGYEYWMHGDFGRNSEHPPLVKLMAALPLLALHPHEPALLPGTTIKNQDFINGMQFLYGNNAALLLGRARVMTALFALALAVAVLLAGTEMFGRHTGLIALALLVLEPTVLGNSALITTDVPVTCCIFVAVYLFYRWMSKPAVGRLACFAVATALCPVVKHAGVLIFPILVLLALGELLLNRRYKPSTASIRNIALALLLAAAASYVVLWSVYEFRYAARPDGLALLPTLQDHIGARGSSGAEKTVLRFVALHHLAPEAYLWGWADILHVSMNRPTFLFGAYHLAWKWYWFPLDFLFKTSLPVLLLLLAVPFSGVWHRRREFLYASLPLLAYLLFAISSHMNAAARYILPVYPFCILLGAAAGWKLACRWRAAGVALGVLLVWAAATSLHVYPDYLAYVNEAFGGPSQAYKLAAWSDDDWGQSLIWTRQYLDAHHITDCWIDNSPAEWMNPADFGIPCKRLPSSNLATAARLAAIGAYPENARNVMLNDVFSSLPVIPATISGTVILSGSELLLWQRSPYAVFTSHTPDDEIDYAMTVYHGTFNVPLLAAFSHSAMGFRLAQQGQFEQAIAEAQTAVTLAPDSDEAEATLAQVLALAGSMDAAHAARDRAIALATAQHDAALLAVLERSPRGAHLR